MMEGDFNQVIGCMSGTSLDGVDVAALVTNGVEVHEFGPSVFQAYTECQRETIRAALGSWPGSRSAQEASLVVTQVHLDAINGLSIDCPVGFHGQTLNHDPAHGRTHQTGSPARLAEQLGQSVVGDFRAADMEAGGEGAPLAPFYHFALAKHLRITCPVLFLNLGGVANVSWIDPTCTAPESGAAVLAFDTGPANAPINDLVHERVGLPFDTNGELAARGDICSAVLQDFLRNPYFDRQPPKSLDRDTFAMLLRMVGDLDVSDAAATLTACAAHAIAAGFRHLPRDVSLIVACGGGRKNRTLMKMIADQLTVALTDIDSLGVDGDMLEAQAFGYLAVRCMRHLPTSSPSTTGCRYPVCGGVIYR